MSASPDHERVDTHNVHLPIHAKKSRVVPIDVIEQMWLLKRDLLPLCDARRQRWIFRPPRG
jgi:hypothetical protein